MTKGQKRVDPFYLSEAWQKLRRWVLARDGYRCVVCGRSVRGKGQSRVDHIKPRATHPQLELNGNNCRTLCPSCDNKRHAEKGGAPGAALRGCDINGLPLDPGHPWYGTPSPYGSDDTDP